MKLTDKPEITADYRLAQDGTASDVPRRSMAEQPAQLDLWTELKAA